MTQENFYRLVDKYLLGNLTALEKEQLLNALGDPNYEAEFHQIAEKAFISDAFEGPDNRIRRDRIFHELQHQIDSKESISPQIIRMPLWKQIVAAAVFITAIAGLGVYFLSDTRTAKPQVAAIEDKPVDVMPGYHGATLSLSDGRTLALDSSSSGVLTKDENVEVIKDLNGISYVGKTDKTVYNKITTEKGQQWSVTLPDGSRIWMNSGSWIRYPLTFTKDERRISVSGEVYLEVQSDRSRPFKVMVNDKEITVLGTRFNINSYTDEPTMRTTLLEGLISLKSGKAKTLLHPGEQASIVSGEQFITVQPVQAEDAIAWKNGYFNFRNADLQTVMRQLARWYDIEVSYKGKVPELQFEGSIDRSLKLSSVLRILGRTGVRFKIDDGNKLIILP